MASYGQQVRISHPDCQSLLLDEITIPQFPRTRKPTPGGTTYYDGM